MNWTGGSLVQSRKKNASLTAIQKKHFARVRGQLYHGRSPPLRLHGVLFRDTRNGGHLPAVAATTSDLRHDCRNSQLTLDEFENVRPVVRQLQSLRPRHSGGKMSCRQTDVQSSPCNTDRSSRSSTHRKRTGRAPGSTYGAEAHASKAVDVQAAEDELEIKRRELLDTSDWMGLRKAKPLKISFPDAEDRDLIGKRRRVNEDHYQPVPVLPRANTLQKPVVKAFEELSTRRNKPQLFSSPSRITIHIGSSEKASSANTREREREESFVDNQRKRSARPSEEMLFDDQDSTPAAIRTKSSAPSSLRPSEHASDEMLFDREWSGIVSPSEGEFMANEEESTRQPQYPVCSPAAVEGRPQSAYTISSGTCSEFSSETRHTARNSNYESFADAPGPEGVRYPRALPIAVKQPPSTDRREYQASDEGFRDHNEEHQPSDRTKRPFYGSDSNDTNESPHLHSVTRKNPLNFQSHFTQATAPELTSLLAPTRDRKEVANDVRRDKSQHAAAGIAYPVENTRGDGTAQEIVQELRHTPKIGHHSDAARDALDPSLPNGEATIPFPATEPAMSPSPPPLPKPATSQPQPPTHKPATPSPEEDEIIWRTFVFGTQNPDDDSIFKDSLLASRAAAPRSTRLNMASSSPILPIASTNDATAQSTPIARTQPSLLAEASSSLASPSLHPAPAPEPQPATSAPYSSSPARAQPLPSTIAGPASITASTSSFQSAHPSSSSPSSNRGPPKTDHSIQAQAGSSDELAPSSSPPQRADQPAPAVVFRKPRRYVGNGKASSGAPIVLGVKQRKGGGRWGKEEEDDEAEGYGGKARARKKKRGEWRQEVVDAMEQDEDEEDEIVD